MSIKKHRVAIDKIDAKIVYLLNRRTKHVLGIGKDKLAAGKQVDGPVKCLGGAWEQLGVHRQWAYSPDASRTACCLRKL